MRSRGWRATRWLPAGIVAALVASAFPAVAGATDYCVAPDTSCGGTNVATFEQALDLADNAPDADRIFLGAGTYAPPPLTGFMYAQQTYPVEIVGAGEGQTILTNAPGAGQSVLYFMGGANSSVHDLTIRLPQSAAAGTSGLTTDGTARRIEVLEDASETNFRYGVSLQPGGSLEDSTVTLAGDDRATGVFASFTPTEVRRSTVSAGTGILSYGTTIDRSRVTGSKYGVRTITGVTNLSDSLVRLTDCCTGIRVDETGSATLNADGVTLVVPVSADVVGVGVSTATYAAGNATLTMTNSIIRGSNPLFAYAIGTGHAKINVSYSDYDPSGNSTSGANTSITETNVSNVGDAGFVDAAGGDYHLLPGSALVDAGDPATAQGLDLDGNPLVTDGNADGVPRRDEGAFELQSTPGAQPTGGTQGAGQQAGTPALDTVAPLVSGFRADPSLFAVARAGTAITATVHRGTRFRYNLSEPAGVTVKIQRARAGRTQLGKCVRPTAQLRHAKRCTRYHTVGTLTRNGKKGANSTAFTGRIGRRALRPGSYRALIRATDAAGNRSAPKATRLRVAKS
jgi:hypothetical protein